MPHHKMLWWGRKKETLPDLMLGGVLLGLAPRRCSQMGNVVYSSFSAGLLAHSQTKSPSTIEWPLWPFLSQWREQYIWLLSQ